MAKRDNPGRADRAKGKPDMKTFAISLVSIVCVIAALAWSQTSRAQAVPLVFQTTFSDAETPDTTNYSEPGTHWKVSDYFFDSYGARNLPGYPNATGKFGVFQNQYTDLGGPNQATGDDGIIAAANYPGGGGGKGFRHWRGNGKFLGDNDLGGSMTIKLGTSVGEFWLRMYMRYQLGFTFGQPTVSDPGYTKDLRGDGADGWIFGIQGGHSWGILTNASGNITSSKSWQSTMGGMKGDGQWHCYEFHWQNGTNSHIEMWVDNIKALDRIVTTSADTTGNIIIGLNQNAVGDSNGVSVTTGGTPTDWYTDYDDIAISATGRIGCLGLPVPTALPTPKNLRVQ